MTFCPNTFCPNAYLSQKKVNCPKCQKSQLHFVPKANCPNYILSQYPFVSWIIHTTVLESRVVYFVNNRYSHSVSKSGSMNSLKILSSWAKIPVLDYRGQQGRKPVDIDFTVSVKEHNHLSMTLFCPNILTPYQTLSLSISSICSWLASFHSMFKIYLHSLTFSWFETQFSNSFLSWGCFWRSLKSSTSRTSVRMCGGLLVMMLTTVLRSTLRASLWNTSTTLTLGNRRG